MALAEHISQSIKPEGLAGDERTWRKQWLQVAQSVDKHARQHRLQFDIDQTAALSLIETLDPLENNPAQLGRAVAVAAADGVTHVVGAICPPYSNPNPRSQVELDASTGRVFADYDPHYIADSFRNMGSLLRSLHPSNPTHVHIWAVTQLASDFWGDQVVNQAVVEATGRSRSSLLLSRNAEAVEKLGSSILHNEYGIQLSLHPLIALQEKIREELERGFALDFLARVRQGERISDYQLDAAYSFKEERLKGVLVDYEDRSSPTFAKNWGSWGLPAVIANFVFYRMLGETQGHYCHKNQGIVMQMDIEPLSSAPEQMSVFSAGFHGTDRLPSFGIQELPLMIPRPRMSIDSQGRQSHIPQGIRQRWVLQ